MNQQLIGILQKFSITEEDQSKNPQTSQTPQTNQPRNAVIFSPRLLKLEFPRFFGEDLADWIYKEHQYFSYYKILTNEQLLMASFHIDAEALVWFP